MATWRKLIQEEMNHWGESFEDVVDSTLSSEELDVTFNSYLGRGLESFTLWTHNRVYFPAISSDYHRSRYAVSVSRNPNGEATPPVGEE